MSDPGFREIHLSGKHVVFLFMAGAVAAVGIFLLGVSVGKGITKADASTIQATPSPAVTAADAASPASTDTRPKPGELNYFGALQGKGTPNPSTSPEASPSSTPAASPAAAVTKPSPTPTPDKPAAKASPSPSPSPSSTPAATGAWYAVVDSFSSRSNAANRLAEVKKKGYDNAAIATTPGAKAPYKVRVGPFNDRPAADAMKARLAKDGIKSIVSR